VRFKLPQVTGIVVVGRSGFPTLPGCVALPVIALEELALIAGVTGGVSATFMEHADNIKTAPRMSQQKKQIFLIERLFLEKGKLG
jgi:hypothetical protein